MIAGGQIGAAKGKHERGGVDRLLIRFRLGAPAAVPSGVSHEGQLSILETYLLQEVERLAGNAQACPLARYDESLEERQGN